jgi:hypothetical protein
MHTVFIDDARALFEVFLRQPVLPHPRVLDQVVVNGHDLVVILKRHDAPSHLAICRTFSDVPSCFLTVRLTDYMTYATFV